VTFIFVQAYSSVLFTYVVAPVNRPLINSIYDTFERKKLNNIKFERPEEDKQRRTLVNANCDMYNGN
jgi:hypothetical protein